MNGHGLLISVILLSAASLHAATDLTLAQLVHEPQQHLGQSVRVAGTVKSINYLPEIRDGASILSFTLTDGTNDVRILTPLAPTLARGDRITIRGTLLNTNGTLEIDASAGDIRHEHPEQTRNTLARESAADPNALRGVPTVIIDTPWSITVNIATVVSALFAIIAAASVLLHARRYNVRLDITTSTAPHVVLAGEQRELHVTLRLLTTGHLAPCLSHAITLRISGATIVATRAASSVTDRPIFPLVIKDDVHLTLHFTLPKALPAPEGTPAQLLFQDAFCRRTFRTTLHVDRSACTDCALATPIAALPMTG